MDTTCKETCRNMPAGHHTCDCREGRFNRLHQVASDLLSSVHMLAEDDVKILGPQIDRLSSALKEVGS